MDLAAVVEAELVAVAEVESMGVVVDLEVKIAQLVLVLYTATQTCGFFSV